MKTTVSVYDFRDAFQKIRPNNFSYDGLAVLFEHLEQLEDDCGQEMELDVVAICCDYAEDTPASIAESYSIDLEDCEDEDEIEDTVRDYLNDEGAYIGITDTGSIVYRQF